MTVLAWNLARKPASAMETKSVTYSTASGSRFPPRFGPASWWLMPRAEVLLSTRQYHLVEVPLNVIVPSPKHLVRLRLFLHLESDGTQPVIVQDVFPPDQWSVKDHDIGEFSLDVSKALSFVCPAPITDVLGLKLKWPLRWQTKEALIECSDRGANPAEWYVVDEQIAKGFTGYVIVRAGKGANVKIRPELVGELRREYAWGLLKGRFQPVRGQEDLVYSI